MKTLYESLLSGKVSKPSAKVQPSSRDELKQIIDEHIKQIKPRPGQEIDLNWIDISGVDDLSELFRSTNYIPVIDKWEIDHVEDFRFMFVYNKHIVRSPIPILQKKLLANECYMGMFQGCSKLEVAPELPAMELKEMCYWSMFQGCTSLKTAPELPAMKLALGCYTSMFRDCTSLKTAPELPAKKLVTNCYDAMFKNCSKLETKAKVPDGVVLNSLVAMVMYLDCPNIK